MTLKEKIINGELLSEREVEDILWENADFEYQIVDEIQHGHGRWTAYMESIIEIDGKFYSLGWQRGLTEYQESEFDAQRAEEVIKTEKIITVWKAIEKES